MRIASAVLSVAVLVALALMSRPPEPVRVPAAAPRPAIAAGPAIIAPPERPQGAAVRLSDVDQRAMEIANLLHNGTAVDHDLVFDRLLPAMVAADAPGAARLARDWPAGAERRELIRRVAQLWSEADIGGAVRWLASLDDQPADQELAVRSARAEIGRTDTAGALELSQYFGVGYDDGSLEHLVQLWTEESPADAVAWITGRPPGPERDVLLARVAWVRAQRDPGEALALVTGYMPVGATRDSALADVARQWARRDPVEAMAWAGRLPDGMTRTRSLAAIAAAARSR